MSPVHCRLVLVYAPKRNSTHRELGGNVVLQAHARIHPMSPRRRLEPTVAFPRHTQCRHSERVISERSDHTLQSTALVHEAYIRLVDVDKVQHWDSRGHFFSAAAEAMRRILVESARRKQSIKRGGAYKRIEIKDDLVQSLGDSPDELIDFNSALDQLAKEDAQAAELVKLRLFAGLSLAEACRVLGIPSSTAYDSWEFARAWFTCRHGSGS